MSTRQVSTSAFVIYHEGKKYIIKAVDGAEALKKLNNLLKKRK